MPDLSRLLRRFRRLGAPPGPPAAGIGVPERPGEALTLELQGVFVAVDAIEDEARAIRGEAVSDAKRLLAAHQAEATVTLFGALPKQPFCGGGTGSVNYDKTFSQSIFGDSSFTHYDFEKDIC